MSKKVSYDKEYINANLGLVVDSYFGAPLRREGNRSIYTCPYCGAEQMKFNPNYKGAPIIGCFKANCEADQVMDTIAFIAFMEQLVPKRDFERICERALEILPGASPAQVQAGQGTPEPATPEQKTYPPVSDQANALGGGAQSSEEATEPIRSTAGGAGDGKQDALQESGVQQDGKQGPDENYTDLRQRSLRHEVLEGLLKEAPLNARAHDFLYDRGLTDDTILDGRFGFFRAEQGKQIVENLCNKFGRDILKAPGFSLHPEKKTVRFTLLGYDRLLIPYFDRDGYITNVEGRIMPEDEEKVDQKYVSLRGSGSHLYVFPEMNFEDIEAFCEGVFGAVVAAQEGVAVGSIQGFQRYRKSGADEVLEELEGLDFAGRKISYIPDVDDPPKDEVMDKAPEAARWLIERQNGVPTIALLPGGKDLDEYLRGLPSTSGPKAIRALVESSESLEAFAKRREKEKEEKSGKDSSLRPSQGAHSGEREAVQTPKSASESETAPTANGDGHGTRPDRPQRAGTPIGEGSDFRSTGRGQASPANDRRPENEVASADANAGASADARQGTPSSAGVNSHSVSANRVGVALKVLAGRDIESQQAGDNQHPREPTADEVVWRLRRRGWLALKAFFVIVVSIALFPVAAALTELSGAEGLQGLLITAALAATIPLALLVGIRHRRRRHRRFIEGRWIPGER